MGKIFKPPVFSSEELNISARLSYYLGAGLIVFSLLFVLLIPFLAPELLKRSIAIAIIVIPSSLVIMALVRYGKLSSAGIILSILLWIIVTGSVSTAGGMSAPLVVAYMLIIMISGMVSRQRTNYISTILCSLTIVVITFVQLNGSLPKPIDYSPITRTSVYIFIFVVTGYLQNITIFNTRDLLNKTLKSEARYRSLLENIPITTYIDNMDADAGTEYVSPQVEKLLGYPRNLFTEDPLFWTKILHPDDMQAVLEESRRTSESEETFEMEYRILTKDKRTIWVKDEATLVRDKETNEPLYWLGIWTDITSRKQFEKEQADFVNEMTKRTIQLQTAAEVARAATSILDINELLPTVVELIRDHFEYYFAGIYIIDELHEWADLHAATGEMGNKMLEMGHRLKIEDSSMIGWCITHRQARIALAAGEDSVRFVNPLLPLTRSEMAFPLIAHGEIIGAMTIQSEKTAAFSSVDITALQAMSNQVANAIENARLFTDKVNLNKELEGQNEELEQFTYTVSHDLRSPLVTIRGFLGYLKQDAKSGNFQRFDKDLSRISKAVDKMQTLLNELLELSRVGRIVNPPEDVPFGEIVQETAELLSGQLEAGNVRLNISGDLPIVHVDRVRIAEAVQNLISNAAKFMGDQSNPTIDIGIKGLDADDQPIFFVRDNGIGIHPDFHERIFGLFNRLDSEIEGTGIGLSLVKRIIEVHSGRIWLESEPGEGSTFLFTLPISTADRT